MLVAAAPSVPALPVIEAQASSLATTPGLNAVAPSLNATGPTTAESPSASPETSDDDAGTANAPAPEGEAVPGNEIVVTHRSPSDADPVEQLNVVSYQAVQALDSVIVEPVTKAYAGIVPEPLRDGFHNVLDNLDEPIVFLNFLLQLKPGKALETLGRFAVNTTLGIGGLFDVAKKKPFNLPRRSNGLADTLGYYGVGPGPYLFLPVIGSTTVRDLLARPFDLMVLPTIAPKPFADPKVALGKGVLSAIDERDQLDDKFERIHAAADPYLVQREEYLARRKAEIEVLKGKRKSIYDPPYYVLPDKPEDAEAPSQGTAPEGTSSESGRP